MQVSDYCITHLGVPFLFVIGSGAGDERAQSIPRFINNTLGMETETWNISLYIGFDQRNQDQKKIFDFYELKAIITAVTNNNTAYCF